MYDLLPKNYIIQSSNSIYEWNSFTINNSSITPKVPKTPEVTSYIIDLSFWESWNFIFSIISFINSFNCFWSPLIFSKTFLNLYSLLEIIYRISISFLWLLNWLIITFNFNSQILLFQNLYVSQSIHKYSIRNLKSLSHNEMLILP